VFTDASPFPQGPLLKLVGRHTRRAVKVESGTIRVVLRESDRRLYLFAVNYDLHEPTQGVVALTGPHHGAVDLGCDAAFPVKTTMAEGTTRLELRLHPGEGTVIRLDK
jgi:hypothetical protein